MSPAFPPAAPPEDALGWFPLVMAVPLVTFLGARAVDPDDPAAGISLVVGDNALNAAGVLHGGAVAALLDLAAYLAALPALHASEQAVTHAFSATYLSATRPGEELVATGVLLRRARHVMFMSATMRATDQLVAVASVTKSVVPHRPAVPVPG
jgi:uncharacterized protein (TIGR00369 family)